MNDQGMTRVACACGKRLAVKTEWAGRRVRCPACRAIVTIPAAAESAASATAADDFFPTLAERTTYTLAPTPPAGPRSSQSPPRPAPAPAAAVTPGQGRECPCCGREWPVTSKFCVDCGVNLKSGRSVQMYDDEHIAAAYTAWETVIRVISWFIWFGVLPMASEAFGFRKPWVVRGIALVTTVFSVWYYFAAIVPMDRGETPSVELANLMAWMGERTEVDDQVFDPAIGARWYQPLTCTLLHGGMLHLAGNLLFLLIFGTRVNMLIGNTLTAILYPLLAYGSIWIESIAQPDAPFHPTLGASGAIMGLAGVYAVLLPAARVHVAVWLRVLLVLFYNGFAVRGFFVVLFYIGWDALDVYLGTEDFVAHWAHLGGFMVGAALASLLLITRLVHARGGDLFSVILGSGAWPLVGRPNRRALTIW